MIKIEMLRCFCTVAQTGSLAEAADRLGRTQSAVSMTLKQLEGHLGRNLFQGERKNALSSFGEQVFDLALKQVRQFDQTVQNIQAAARTERGLIRIVSVPSVGALIYPPLLDHMTRHHPGLRIELRDTDSQQVLDAVAEDRADIGIASGQYKLNGVRTLPLFEDQFGLVAAAGHPLISRNAAPTLADISATPLIRNALWDLIETPHFKASTQASSIAIQNTHSLITMVQTGQWVTVLPRTTTRFGPDSIVFRRISDLPDKRQVFLYVRERVRFPALTEACTAFILEQQLG